MVLMLYIIKNGFDTMVSKTNLPTVECKNLRSPFRNPDIVDNLIKQEVEKGYLKGAFERSPFDIVSRKPDRYS
jgi:hypothetical protein